jgi:hypothetical protein
MVIQRTVEKLRERPEHERAAVAGSIAIGVVAILLVGWVAIFLHGFGSGGNSVVSNPPVTNAPTATTSATSVSTSSAPALEWQASSDTLDQSSATTSNSTGATAY